MAAVVPLPNSQGTLPQYPPWEPFFSDFLFSKIAWRIFYFTTVDAS
jgi:hypothetical protein